MLHTLTRGHKVVLALCVAVLVAAVFLGYRLGEETETPGEPQVQYTLTDAGQVPITVHVVGAVQRPGLYTLAAGARIRDVIEAAGGFTHRADPASVNLAAFVDDGDQVRVQTTPDTEPDAHPSPTPTTSATSPSAQPRPSARRQTRQKRQPRQPTRSAPAGRTASRGSPGGQTTPTRTTRDQLPSFARRSDGRQVRINHAGLDELQTISGVGPETARNIIYHRNIHGPFRTFNELDDVPGIGPVTVEHIRVSATLR